MMYESESTLQVPKNILTLTALITTAADDIHKYFFIFFSEKIRLNVSSESSARQRIHMKNQALFSSKDISKKLKCRLLQLLFSALRVKVVKVCNCVVITFFVKHNAFHFCQNLM